MLPIINSNNSKLRKLGSRLVGRTINQKIFRIYFITIVVGAFLLTLPFSHINGTYGNYFESLFTAISAFTNTGLTVSATSDTFSFFGQLVILLLIQVGGLGFLTIVVYLWSWIRRRTSFNVEQRIFLHAERGSFKRVESLPSVKAGVVVILVSEIIGAIILTFFFFFATPMSPTNTTGSGTTTGEVIGSKGNFIQSLWLGIFHSVSSANNAGFDILGRHSIIPYRNDENNFLSVILLIESVIGGIGYPVFYDVYLHFKNKKRNSVSSFSLFTKIAVVSYIFIAIVGVFFALGFEFFGDGLLNSVKSNPGSFGWGRNEKANKVWNVMYITFSSRSSGFSSINTDDLTDATKWLLSALMFVGASPASTGGGIRNITIFIIMVNIFYSSIGRRYLSVFQRTISKSIILESYNVFVLSTLLVVISMFVIFLGNANNSRSMPVGDVVFEATSAFGTTGLTSGITTKTNYVGKIALMVLMFIGQLGASNALLSLTDQNPTSKNIRYCSENLRLS